MSRIRIRVAALVLIALVAGGVAYAHLAPVSGAMAVPAGAKAGQLSLKPCTYQTEDGPRAADCGTLVVPENRSAAHSRLIALPVVRIRAASAHPGDPVFRLNGGPGQTNMRFPEAGRFTGDHDVVLVGYRGVDGSSVLACPEVSSALAHSADLVSAATATAYTDAFRACAKRLSASGVDLAGYSLPERVDDLDAVRAALGYNQIDLVSESAGTRTAMIYSWRYPKRIAGSVMIGVNPPGDFVWNPATTDQQLQAYSTLCAADAACRSRTGDLAASMRQVAAQLPGHWMFLPIKPGNVQLTSFFGLFDQRTGPVTGPMTLDAWLAAAHGDPSGMWLQSVAADLIYPSSFVWGDLAASGTIDDQAALNHFADPGRYQNTILGDAGNDFLWGDGAEPGAWPVQPDTAQYTQVRTSQVPTLMIGGGLDFTTPPQNATSGLLPYLPNGHQVVLPDIGHATDFWSYEPAAGSYLINTFLATGTVDQSHYTRAAVDFTPSVSLTALAKWIFGALVGLAVLTLLFLAVMAFRVVRRGRFGRRSSAALRLLSPLLLGLGGWCLSTLITLATLPAVPITGAPSISLAVGVPIGLGAFLAWFDRDRPGALRLLGLAAALAGGLSGAWFGATATPGIASLATAVVAAAAGTNLGLLVLDMTGVLDSGKRGGPQPLEHGMAAGGL